VTALKKLTDCSGIEWWEKVRGGGEGGEGVSKVRKELTHIVQMHRESPRLPARSLQQWAPPACELRPTTGPPSQTPLCSFPWLKAIDVVNLQIGLMQHELVGRGS